MSKLSVLIVDDDIPTVELIQSSVHWENLNIEKIYIAYNVRGAKVILESNSVDIIVSDVEMPQGNGLELLQWLRDVQYKCEFLLFTCHESFEYASQAINYNAAAYITKPFDLRVMELSLYKIASKIEQQRELLQKSKNGEWLDNNLRSVTLQFWEMLISGHFSSREQIEKELESRKIEFDFLNSICLVCFKINGCEQDIERLSTETFDFVVESFISEILFEKYLNEAVVKTNLSAGVGFCTIIPYTNENEMHLMLENVVTELKKYLKCMITVCISNKISLCDVAEKKTRIDKVLLNNLAYCGKIFYEDEAISSMNETQKLLDMSRLSAYVENNDKTSVLQYIKQVFEELAMAQNLNVNTLYLMQQEITQCVYANLLQNGIQATLLLHGELYMALSEHASESTVDFVRWINTLLGKTFDYEKEIQSSGSIVDKIHLFIQIHYAENITRNEIAKELYLAPEYLSKLYTKKTGKHLKDYINEHRIEKAKDLLRKGDINVSDVAQSVGFDNFSYFSTLFKKIVGKTPREYQKR
ncbi:MAG: response regulator [Christensenella sp.]